MTTELPTDDPTGGSDAPEDRCGYVYDVSTLHDVGACTCWRPVWDDDDRCIWHADRADKPAEAFEEFSPRESERLDGAIVRKLSLDETDWFEDVSLVGAELTSVDLRDASAAGADLREATLEHVDARRSDFSEANLEDATVTLSDLRQATFVDARFEHAVFSNVRIGRETVFGETTVYEDELEDIEERHRYQSAAEAAVWAYREIQDLHEDNALPIEARHFYMREKDVRRRLAWHNGNYAQAVKSEGTRWITGYGMSPWRVIATAAVVILVSAFLYPTTGGLEETVGPGGLGAGPEASNGTQAVDASEQRTITWQIDDPDSTSRYYILLVFFRSLYFSVVTFTTVGYGDISPVGETARAIAGVEALIGQLLVAVLVFVLTRRLS